MKENTQFTSNLFALIAALVLGTGCSENFQFIQTDLIADETTGVPLGGGTTEPTPVEVVEDLCTTGDVEVLNQTLIFPNPNEVCAWGTNGNLNVRNQWVQARRKQSISIPIPAGALVCSMAFSSVAQEMKFDDEIFLLFNDVVLASSFDYSDRLITQNGLLIYDWANLVGTPYTQSNGSQPFCLGAFSGKGNCSIPRTETTGTITLDFAQDLIYSLSARGSSNLKPAFQFVTTGDNDSSDCKHKDFSFSVSVGFVRR